MAQSPDQGREAAIRAAGPRDDEPRDATPFEAVNYQFDRAARRLLLRAYVKSQADEAGVSLRLAAFMVGVRRVARARELRGV